MHTARKRPDRPFDHPASVMPPPAKTIPAVGRTLPEVLANACLHGPPCRTVDNYALPKGIFREKPARAEHRRCGQQRAQHPQPGPRVFSSSAAGRLLTGQPPQLTLGGEAVALLDPAQRPRQRRRGGRRAMRHKFGLAFALLAAAVVVPGCSSLYFRAGQPVLIGDPRPGTASHTYLTNDAGQLFRLRRDGIAGVQMGGQRTVIASLFTGNLAVILLPAGLFQWLNNASIYDATDGTAGQALDIVDEVEVDARGAP